MNFFKSILGELKRIGGGIETISSHLERSSLENEKDVLVLLLNQEDSSYKYKMSLEGKTDKDLLEGVKKFLAKKHRK